MDINLTARTADFLLAEAGGERSRALYEIPANSGDMQAGTILAASGTKSAAAGDAAAILWHNVKDSAVAQKAAVVNRDCEVHGELLQWPDGATDSEKQGYADMLAAKGIVVRWTVRPAGLSNDQLLDETTGGA